MKRMFAEYSEWYFNLVERFGVIPKSFAGVDANGQQFTLILEGLKLDHVGLHALIKTALDIEKSSVFAFATLSIIMDDINSSPEEELQIRVGDSKSYIWGNWAVSRNADGRCVSLRHRSTLEGNDPEKYPGTWFLTNGLKVSEADQQKYREIWSSLREKAHFTVRVDKPLTFTPAPVPPPLTKEVLDKLCREQLDYMRGDLTPEEFKELVLSRPDPP